MIYFRHIIANTLHKDDKCNDDGDNNNNNIDKLHVIFARMYMDGRKP
jgi:hypothetical protein